MHNFPNDSEFEGDSGKAIPCQDSRHAPFFQQLNDLTLEVFQHSSEHLSTCRCDILLFCSINCDFQVQQCWQPYHHFNAIGCASLLVTDEVCGHTEMLHILACLLLAFFTLGLLQIGCNECVIFHLLTHGDLQL